MPLILIPEDYNYKEIPENKRVRGYKALELTTWINAVIVI